MHRNPFSSAEIQRRLTTLRGLIQARGLDAAIFCTPDNVFYLTGLDHWGYFAPHMLIIPAEGSPVLVTRDMEQVSIRNMVHTAEFRGHSDSETAADEVARVLGDLGLIGKSIGLEMWSSGLSHGLATALIELAAADWSDVSGLTDRMRYVKSAEEQTLIRQAAIATNAAAKAAIAAIHDGAQEHDVAAECHAAMIRAGGEPPGFGPFIRPSTRQREEHTTWGHGHYQSGETVFLELSGCVARYHAPTGRLIHIGHATDEDAEIAEITERAFQAVVDTLKPGKKARDVYAAWQTVVDDAGLDHYRRHHCGYLVGAGCQPSWTGGNKVAGLRHDSDLELAEGMSFHILSWLMGSGRGDFFLSNTVLMGPGGAEVLTTTPHGPVIR
ncbi:MAG: Xaa-Pro peptidase family protein [Pseudomonadota bacterium]